MGTTLRLSQDGVDDFDGLARWRQLCRRRGANTCSADALHWSSFDWQDNRDPNSPLPMPKVRGASKNPMLVNGGITDGKDAELIFDNEAGDAAVVGRPRSRTLTGLI